MKNMLKKLSAAAVIFVFLSNFFPKASLGAINLVKSRESQTVYYLDGLGFRHPFPNFITYKSWYGDDFSKITTVSKEFLATFPLAKNITIRSGKYLVKVQSDPKVYAVEPGGLLRHIQNDEIARALYGSSWEKKVVDLPEIFFDNYKIGSPIKHTWDIPEGVVYKIQGESKYYWKENDTIRPFGSEQAIIDNGYSLIDVVSASNTYYSTKKPVTGISKTVFDPLKEAYSDERDCENKNLKIAFIFLNKGSYTSEQIEKMEAIKSNLSSYYSWATDGLSHLDVSYPIFTLADDGYYINVNNEGKTILVKDEILRSFYEQYEDVFDFVAIFTNFDFFKKEIADFLPVSNIVEGIGKPILDTSQFYGSFGKLKGIINMENIDKYDTSPASKLNEVQNVLVHEILHNWSGAVRFKNTEGKIDLSLLRLPDKAHWSYYDSFVSPLGGSGWADNGDGTFTSAVSLMADTSKKKFSDLDLYLMGLIPSREIEPIKYIVPKIADALGNTLEASEHVVTINQIIEAEGSWQCGNN
ncbi:hypothetical protein C4569_03060 [Candidatus Parcubacteria bacterium]|nr:MAG: hypothetical protein C4569_03060 [Candidatus Parcubacteria bacterium]